MHHYSTSLRPVTHATSVSGEVVDYGSPRVRARFFPIVTNNARVMEEWDPSINRILQKLQDDGDEIMSVQMIVKEPGRMYGYFLMVTVRTTHP